MKAEYNQNLVHLANMIDTIKSNVEKEPILRACIEKAFPVADCGKAGFQAIKEHFKSTSTRGTEQHSLMNSVEQTWKPPPVDNQYPSLAGNGREIY